MRQTVQGGCHFARLSGAANVSRRSRDPGQGGGSRDIPPGRPDERRAGRHLGALLRHGRQGDDLLHLRRARTGGDPAGRRAERLAHRPHHRGLCPRPAGTRRAPLGRRATQGRSARTETRARKAPRATRATPARRGRRVPLGRKGPGRNRAAGACRFERRLRLRGADVGLRRRISHGNAASSTARPASGRSAVASSCPWPTSGTAIPRATAPAGSSTCRANRSSTTRPRGHTSPARP